jgi:TPR repeat protein
MNRIRSVVKSPSRKGKLAESALDMNRIRNVVKSPSRKGKLAAESELSSSSQDEDIPDLTRDDDDDDDESESRIFPCKSNWCIGCDEGHPIEHFSNNQREKIDDFSPRCMTCVESGRFSCWVKTPKSPLQILIERGRVPRKASVEYKEERLGEMILSMQDSFVLLKKFKSEGHHGYGGVEEGLCCMPGCVKRVKLSKCGRCLKEKYCSKDHQRLHYQVHKQECFECRDADLKADECSICLERISKDDWRAKEHLRFDCCGKKAHYECFKKWKKNCPYCRTPLPHSKKESFQMVKSGALKRKPWALLRLAHCYQEGVGVLIDIKKAEKILVLAANQTEDIEVSMNAQSMLGQIFVDSKSALKSIPWYSKAAAAGHATSDYNLGVIYQQLSACTEENMRKGIYHFQCAAVKGHPDAQCNLGLAYFNGTGVEQSNKKGVFWLEMASTGGDSYAQLQLAGCLWVQGIFDPKALRWARKAKSSGEKDAALLVSKIEEKLKNSCACCGISAHESKLKVCSRCEAAYYCNSNCQRLHWNVHREGCCPSVDLDTIKWK